MATPESRVKAKVKKLLKEHGAYQFWPVQTGYGAKTLDCLACHRGYFVAIETKAPGKKPTDLQWVTVEQIQMSGGIAMVVDGDGALSRLDEILEEITHASAGKCTTQDPGRSRHGGRPQSVPGGQTAPVRRRGVARGAARAVGNVHTPKVRISSTVTNPYPLSVAWVDDAV